MDYIVSTAYDGKPRKLWAKTCSVCAKVFYTPKNRLKDRDTCSRRCHGVKRRNRVTVYCAGCGGEFEKVVSHLEGSKSGLHFCSRSCKDSSQRIGGIKEVQPPHYGTAAVPRVALARKRGHQCQACKLKEWMDQPIALEAHHVDGDPTNNKDDNILLLCPNCHAQTSTYRGKNRGRGRKSRGCSANGSTRALQA